MSQEIKPKPFSSLKYEDIPDNLKKRFFKTYIGSLSDKEKSNFLNKAIKKVYPKSFAKPKVKKKSNGNGKK